MRKSLHEIEQIENYVCAGMDEHTLQRFRLRLLTDARLWQEVEQQQESYQLIRYYGRKRLKADIQALEARLLQQADKRSFWQQIKQLFTS